MGPLDNWLWQTVLQYLSPDDLSRIMLTSKSLNQTAKSPALWKSIVVRSMHGLDDLPTVGSDYYKIAAEIHRLRTKGPAADVISAALSATSTDNSQSVHETLVAKTVTFWSSCGDETDLEDDTVSYLLSGHLVLLDRVNVCSSLCFSNLQPTTQPYSLRSIKQTTSTTVRCTRARRSGSVWASRRVRPPLRLFVSLASARRMLAKG